MKYEFSFYKDEDFDEIEELILNSYKWEYPIMGISRIEFSKGLNPKFGGFKKAWNHTAGVYRENNKIIACVLNEGSYEAEVFFLFDSKKRAEDEELLRDMINFSKMYGSNKRDEHKIFNNIYIPDWNKTLIKLAAEAGYKKNDWKEKFNILPFDGHKFNVSLPNGYTIIDGNTTPDFYLSNVHRMAFMYGADEMACETGAEAFSDLRKMKHYDKELELCILDEMKRPVAIAIIWCDEDMPYCELEPLAVVWWERRKGLASAILHEASNRVMEKYPNCKGMKGGDQPFYSKIGYKTYEEIPQYGWERDMYLSWEKESINQNYSDEMNW